MKMKWFALLFLVVMPSVSQAAIKFGTLPKIPAGSAAPAEATPTPYDEIDRVLGLLPKPRFGFVDFGCGADARWCLAAARKHGCKSIGMEIDPTRAKMARERVKQEGLADLIEIYCADSTAYSYQNCDVGVAFLYPETLQKLKPQIESLAAFASYMHKPPVEARLSGDSWIYESYMNPRLTRTAQPMAVWGNQTYSGRVCGNPNCGMCNSIESQLASQVQAPRGHYQKVKRCDGRRCWFETVWVQDN